MSGEESLEETGLFLVLIVRQHIGRSPRHECAVALERIQVLLRREGWRDNHKRTYSIYKEEGLNLRSKRPRRNKAAAHRQQDRC